jgi:lipopolysaccharide biosynthesis glycosyltransferase
MNASTLIVGFDQREALAYHTFCQSVLEKTSRPIQFIPLTENAMPFYKESHQDGSNKFIYSRFLTPYLCNYQGVAIFADGDMICCADISELYELFDPEKAVQVVQHDYLTKYPKKYFGNKNENYPRKNWSSVILWNCAHPAHACLTPEFIRQKPGSYLHRFSWLDDALIGDLPREWNWLAAEYEDNPEAKLIHYTLGTPCIKGFENSQMSEAWWETYGRLLEGKGAG